MVRKEYLTTDWWRKADTVTGYSYGHIGFASVKLDNGDTVICDIVGHFEGDSDGCSFVADDFLLDTVEVY